MTLALTALAVGLASSAWGFCGTYVGDGSSQLSNTYSRIAIARWGEATTLTMHNDVHGDQASFGLVIPVPVDIDEDNLRLVDTALLDRIDDYSQPRMVSYTCEDFYGGAATGSVVATAKGSGASASSSSAGCGGSTSSGEVWFDDGHETGGASDDDPAWIDTGNGVVVEENFELGEYTVYVLRANTGEGLLGWFADNGFVVDDATQGVFDSYIEAGSGFLALRVDLDRLDSRGQWLSPLQIGYYSDIWGLPIRMGTANSTGVQDLVVFAVTDSSSGAVGISNYDPSELPGDECMTDLGVADWYEQALVEATGMSVEQGGSGLSWVREYAWGAGHCDPCTAAGPMTADDVVALGMPGEVQWLGWHFSRLHLRYSADAVDEDLVLYATGIPEQTQLRLVEHNWGLETLLPMCEGEEVEAPGTCYSSEWWARQATSGTSWVFFVPFGALALRRGRRS